MQPLLSYLFNANLNHIFVSLVPRDFLSGSIDLYLYLSHARSNDQYCCSVMRLFLPVSVSLLTIYEEFSSKQTILDSPVHNIWLNTTAKPVLFLTFLDMTSSIECGYAELMSRSDKEYICSHRLCFWFLMSSRTCITTARSYELLL